MTALEVYTGSDGDATKALYARLEKLGPIGIVALNLFRAQKCSSRAKDYRRRSHKSDAYERKNWSLQNLCAALEQHSVALGIRWGWKEDPAQEFFPWVLYVDVPGRESGTAQISFHARTRGVGPLYPGDWDRSHKSAERTVRWVADVLQEPCPFCDTWPCSKLDECSSFAAFSRYAALNPKPSIPSTPKPIETRLL